jgi:hypothetical protein
MTTELAARRVTLDIWNVITAIAPEAKASGLFGVGNTAAAMMVMLKGHELGLPLTASFEFISVIDNKPSLSPRGALAIAMQSPLLESIDIKDTTGPIGCKVTVKRKGGITYTASFTLDDAKAAGLVKPGSGWEKYPGNMCRWRAIGFALDITLPDVIGGLKRADEYGADISPDGDVIEGSWTNVPATPAPEVVPPNPMQAISDRLTALANEFGAERVLTANGNRMPATLEEVEAIHLALVAGTNNGA